MGYWGNAGWQNDNAANWFDDIFAETKIDTKIEVALLKSGDENCDEIRAAITLFILLGHVYIYNSDTFDQHLALSIKKNRELVDYWERGGWDQNSEVKEWLDNEYAILVRRQNNLHVNADQRPLSPETLRSWWSKWID